MSKTGVVEIPEGAARRTAKANHKLGLAIVVDYAEGGESNVWSPAIPTTFLVDDQWNVYLAQMSDDLPKVQIDCGEWKALDEVVTGDIQPVPLRAAFEWLVRVEDFAGGCYYSMGLLSRIVMRALPSSLTLRNSHNTTDLRNPRFSTIADFAPQEIALG